MREERKRRIGGGSSWADSMFRYNASTEIYADKIIQRVVRTLNIADCKVQVYHSNNGLLIMYENQILKHMTYDEIEEHRCNSLNSFEQYIQNLFIQLH